MATVTITINVPQHVADQYKTNANQPHTDHHDSLVDALNLVAAALQDHENRLEVLESTPPAWA